MSLRDIFKNQQSFSNITRNTEISELGKEVESADYMSSYIKLSSKTLSNVDWENPEEFVNYGSAKKYYEDGIENIYKTYPYDGSFKEKIDWQLESPELSLYLFENRYPRYNGYINIGNEYGTSVSASDGYSLTDKQEYIHFNGTLNTSEDATRLIEHYELSNKLSEQKNLKYNLDVNGESGFTIEFYFKKENLLGSQKQVIFDLWNGQQTGSVDYGRVRVEIHPGVFGEEDKLYLEIASGSDGVTMAELGQGLTFTEWKHYAVSFMNEGSNLKSELYVDGDRVQQLLTGSAIGQVKKAVQAYIGSAITDIPGTNAGKGYGKLSGSLDEFRFWKKRRTDKEIARNYFTNIGSGVNSDEANTDLGVYFKFNEGIYSETEISAYDQRVLDYSGRASNGTWTGYSLGSRNTGSALVLSENTTEEFKDPVVYSTHPEVLELLEHYRSYGDEYDTRNTNSMYSTLPDWISTQDSETGEKVKSLMQIMSEFFDDLNLKIKAVPELKNMNFENEEEVSFARKLLDNVGFKTLNLFEDATLLEEFLARTEDSKYEENLYRIKREIYKNIYNNIVGIYKSKGTNKSFRNLLHCFGIDESLVKIKAYADNLEYTFDDRYRNFVSKQKVVDFNKPDNFSSTIYQKQEASNPNSLGFLSGSAILKDYGNTLEACIYFPKKFEKNSVNYFRTSFLESSLFGIHESNDGTWAGTDNASVQVFFKRDAYESKNGYFVLSSSCFSQEISSSLINDVYNNEKWNLSLSLRPEKERLQNVPGSQTTDYILELYGVNTVQDVKQKSFLLTASVGQTEAEDYFSADKMIYGGAHRTNFSGSILMSADTRLDSIRFWNNYIDTDTIDVHSKDVNTFGPKEPYKDKSNDVKNINTLCLHWNFETVTGSNTNSQFLIEDVSSGSLELLSSDAISGLTKYQFTGIGDKFLPNDSTLLKTEYISTSKRNLPDDLNLDNFVNILSEDDEFYTRDSVPLNHYFSVEKSMYGIISQDMINWLGTISDFNDLIGKPKYRYEQEYSELEKLRNIFFRNVENEPDFENFIKLYKWIDEAILNAILQIVPASLNTINNVFNVYESHVLERNKYQHKLPTVEFKGKPPEASLANLVSPMNSWKNGCHSKYNRATQNIDKRTQLSPIINKEINRQETLVYNIESKEMPLFEEKKRETEIIRTRVGFDLTGLSYIEINNIFEALKDC